MFWLRLIDPHRLLPLLALLVSALGPARLNAISQTDAPMVVQGQTCHRVLDERVCEDRTATSGRAFVPIPVRRLGPAGGCVHTPEPSTFWPSSASGPRAP